MTFDTLKGLKKRGVKVELGFPDEMWDTPDAEVTRLKSKVSFYLYAFFEYLILAIFRTYLISRKFGSRISRVFKFAIMEKTRIESVFHFTISSFFKLTDTPKAQLHFQRVFITILAVFGCGFLGAILK